MLSATVLAAMESSETVAELATEQHPASLLLVMMVVVFLILMLLWFLVAAVGKLFVAYDKKKQAEPKDKGPKTPGSSGGGSTGGKVALTPASGAPVAKVVSSAPAAPAVEQGISDETVAAIVGAISAFESAQGTRGVIRSIRKADGSAPARVRTRSAWSQAGIAGNTSPFGV